jgi:hypothetical protein
MERSWYACDDWQIGVVPDFTKCVMGKMYSFIHLCNKSGGWVKVFAVFLWLLVFLFINLQLGNE